jgi:long-subunit fatty acid transport protein
MFPRGKKMQSLGLIAVLGAGTAHAGGSGSGIFQQGGAGAGASSADARGLALNPAAAVGADGTEIHLDVAMMMLRTRYERAPYFGTDPDTDPDRTFRAASAGAESLVPYVAIRSDSLFKNGSKHSKLGLGFSISAPFGRNLNWKDEYPGRYHLDKIRFSTLYAAPTLAIRPTPSLRFGAGPVIGWTRFTVSQRVDLAPTLQEMVPGDPPPPPEMGLLEGAVYVKDASGVSIGFTAGTLIDIGDRATIGLGFVSGSELTVSGRSKVTPSLDLNVYSEGDFELTQNLPPMINAGVRYRANERLELSLDAQWVGWSANDEFHITIRNSQIRSSQADLQFLLDRLDINEGQLIEGILDKDQVAARGWHDTWNATLGAQLTSGSMKSRFDIGYDASAIPDHSVSPGNLDFDTMLFAISTRWEPEKSPWSIGGSITQMFGSPRKISNSRFHTYQPLESGYAYPSGNGEYSATITRLALNTSVRF